MSDSQQKYISRMNLDCDPLIVWMNNARAELEDFDVNIECLKRQHTIPRALKKELDDMRSKLVRSIDDAEQKIAREVITAVHLICV